MWTYWPVRKLARAGEQSGVVTKALRNIAPSRAMRSMFGVLRNGWPVQPRAIPAQVVDEDEDDVGFRVRRRCASAAVVTPHRPSRAAKTETHQTFHQGLR